MDFDPVGNYLGLFGATGRNSDIRRGKLSDVSISGGMADALVGQNYAQSPPSMPSAA